MGYQLGSSRHQSARACGLPHGRRPRSSPAVSQRAILAVARRVWMVGRSRPAIRAGDRRVGAGWLAREPGVGEVGRDCHICDGTGIGRGDSEVAVPGARARRTCRASAKGRLVVDEDVAPIACGFGHLLDRLAAVGDRDADLLCAGRRRVLRDTENEHRDPSIDVRCGDGEGPTTKRPKEADRPPEGGLIISG